MISAFRPYKHLSPACESDFNRQFEAQSLRLEAQNKHWPEDAEDVLMVGPWGSNFRGFFPIW